MRKPTAWTFGCLLILFSGACIYVYHYQRQSLANYSTAQSDLPEQQLYPTNNNQPHFVSHDSSVADSSSPESLAATWTTSREAAVESLRHSENRQSEQSLAWTFGGKAQRGWAVYLPLICRTIEADLNLARTPNSDFVKRLIVWQTRESVPASGVLDETTWGKMIAKWQSDRLKNRTTPTPADMVQAPATDFWDLQRAPKLRFVERETYRAYKQMVQAAVAEPSLGLRATSTNELSIAEPRLKIISAYRSPEYQAQLRRQSPNSGRAGLAVNSPHFTGRALDIYVGGEPVDTKLENRALQTSTPVYRWLTENAHRFGFRPYFYEPWHWEYVGTD